MLPAGSMLLQETKQTRQGRRVRAVAPDACLSAPFGALIGEKSRETRFESEQEMVRSNKH